MVILKGFILLLSWIFITSPTESMESDSKRLLFNDQQSIQALLAQYESELNGLKQRISVLEKDNQSKAQCESELNTLRQRIDVLEKDDKSKGSSIYVRWGRKHCKNNNQTELVYSGIVGGSWFDDPGSGVDYLCLPHDPNVTNLETYLHSMSHSEAGILYGAEYQMNFNKVHYDDDVPCAVCLVHSAVLMIPGKSSCPSYWNIQYSGILSSSKYDHPGSSRFVCLDSDPEYFEGTRFHNDDGKLFYVVRTRCGSLPCPPYVNDIVVPCVVCTK